MSRKILILCSSPRKHGNTNTVADLVAQGAKAAGAEVKSINVANLKLKAHGCIACMGCQRSKKFACVIKDDASKVVQKMLKHDVVVFATPTYFFGPNAQAKVVMDRMFCTIKFDPKTGEVLHPAKIGTLALISTAGGSLQDSGIQITEAIFKIAAQFSGGKFHSLLIPSAPQNPKDMAANKTVQQKALAFGRKLAGGK